MAKKFGLLWDDGRLTDVGQAEPFELRPADAARARWVELDPKQRHPLPSPSGYDPVTKLVVRRERVPAEYTDGELAVCALANPQDKGLRAEVDARAGRILSPGGGS